MTAKNLFQNLWSLSSLKIIIEKWNWRFHLIFYCLCSEVIHLISPSLSCSFDVFVDYHVLKLTDISEWILYPLAWSNKWDFLFPEDLLTAAPSINPLFFDNSTISLSRVFVLIRMLCFFSFCDFKILIISINSEFQ